MASYVISDIHGEYEKFIDLINQINLRSDDTLYILGDVIDRGASPMKVLLKMRSMPNVVPIAGNHEFMCLTNLNFLMKEITEDSLEELTKEKMRNYNEWIRNGGQTTIDEFIKNEKNTRDFSHEMKFHTIVSI